jgi:hypothetical protein
MVVAIPSVLAYWLAVEAARPNKPLEPTPKDGGSTPAFGVTESGSASESVSESRHEMTFGYEERRIHSRIADHEEAAVYGAAGIDTDADSDSDPEAGGRVTGLPNKPLQPTRRTAPRA